MVYVENKAKRLSSVNHTTKTIHSISQLISDILRVIQKLLNSKIIPTFLVLSLLGVSAIPFPLNLNDSEFVVIIWFLSVVFS